MEGAKNSEDWLFRHIKTNVLLLGDQIRTPQGVKVA